MRGRPSVKGAAKISAGARRRPLFGLFRWPLHAGAARERLSYVSRPNSSVCGRFRRAARCVSTRAKPRSSGRDFGQGRVALRHLSVVAAAQGCMTMMKVSTVLPCAPHRLAASEHGMVSRHRQRVDVIAWSLPAVSTACPPRIPHGIVVFTTFGCSSGFFLLLLTEMLTLRIRASVWCESKCSACLRR